MRIFRKNFTITAFMFVCCLYDLVNFLISLINAFVGETLVFLSYRRYLEHFKQLFAIFSSLPALSFISCRVLPLSLRREQCLSFSNLVAKFRGFVPVIVLIEEVSPDYRFYSREAVQFITEKNHPETANFKRP